MSLWHDSQAAEPVYSPCGADVGAGRDADEQAVSHIRPASTPPWRARGKSRLMTPSSFRAREIQHDIPLEPDESVQLALQDPLLIGVRTEALRAVLGVGGWTDPVTLHAL